MYACMHACVYVCATVYICLYICVSVHACIYVCACVYIFKCLMCTEMKIMGISPIIECPKILFASYEAAYKSVRLERWLSS